jgi:phage terminase small subunit
MPDRLRDGEVLTPKQTRFVAEYLIDLDSAAAARRAGYSKKTAQQLGYQLLQHPSVRRAVMEGKAKQLDRAAITAADVLRELGRVAFANMRDYFDEHGDAKHPGQLTVEQGAGLAGWEVLIKNAKAGDGVTDTIHKVKLGEKVRALEALGKHHRLFVERIEIVDPDGRVKRLQAARKRTDKK